MKETKRSLKTVSDPEKEPDSGLFDIDPPSPRSQENTEEPLAEALRSLRQAIRYSTAKINSRRVPAEEKTKWANVLAYQIAVLTKLVKGTPEEKEAGEDLVTAMSKLPEKCLKIIYPAEKTPTKGVKVFPGDTGKDF